MNWMGGTHNRAKNLKETDSGRQRNFFAHNRASALTQNLNSVKLSNDMINELRSSSKPNTTPTSPQNNPPTAQLKKRGNYENRTSIRRTNRQELPKSSIESPFCDAPNPLQKPALSKSPTPLLTPLIDRPNHDYLYQDSQSIVSDLFIPHSDLVVQLEQTTITAVIGIDSRPLIHRSDGGNISKIIEEEGEEVVLSDQNGIEDSVRNCQTTNNSAQDSDNDIISVEVPKLNTKTACKSLSDPNTSIVINNDQPKLSLWSPQNKPNIPPSARIIKPNAPKKASSSLLNTKNTPKSNQRVYSDPKVRPNSRNIDCLPASTISVLPFTRRACSTSYIGNSTPSKPTKRTQPKDPQHRSHKKRKRIPLDIQRLNLAAQACEPLEVDAIADQVWKGGFRSQFNNKMQARNPGKNPMGSDNPVYASVSQQHRDRILRQRNPIAFGNQFLRNNNSIYPIDDPKSRIPHCANPIYQDSVCDQSFSNNNQNENNEMVKSDSEFFPTDSQQDVSKPQFLPDPTPLPTDIELLPRSDLIPIKKELSESFMYFHPQPPLDPVNRFDLDRKDDNDIDYASETLQFTNQSEILETLPSDSYDYNSTSQNQFPNHNFNTIGHETDQNNFQRSDNYNYPNFPPNFPTSIHHYPPTVPFQQHPSQIITTFASNHMLQHPFIPQLPNPPRPMPRVHNRWQPNPREFGRR